MSLAVMPARTEATTSPSAALSGWATAGELTGCEGPAAADGPPWTEHDAASRPIASRPATQLARRRARNRTARCSARGLGLAQLHKGRVAGAGARPRGAPGGEPGRSSGGKRSGTHLTYPTAAWFAPGEHEEPVMNA